MRINRQNQSEPTSTCGSAYRRPRHAESLLAYTNRLLFLLDAEAPEWYRPQDAPAGRPAK